MVVASAMKHMRRRQQQRVNGREELSEGIACNASRQCLDTVAEGGGKWRGDDPKGGAFDFPALDSLIEPCRGLQSTH